MGRSIMIEFEDLTLIEANGKLDEVKKIMLKDGCKKWMLRSKVFIQAQFMEGTFIINFWHDGRMIIDEMLRPASLDIPNDDIVELSRWSVDNGWQIPEPSYKIMEGPRLFDFWQRQYQSGLIKSSILDEKEEGIVNRITASEKEQNYD